MMYTTAFMGMLNPFLMLNFQFKVKVMSKSRWPSKCHLENGTFNLYFIVVDLTFSEHKKKKKNFFGDSYFSGVLERIQLCCQDGNFGQLS